MALNFVKFQRGSQAAYDRLKLNNRLEDDALYFIYDKDQPDDGGLLYLGKVLIGGTGTAVGASQLDDLSDVTISGVTLQDGMILKYNATSSQWKPISIKTAIEQSGASLDAGISVINGTLGDEESVNDALTRLDVDKSEGDIVFVSGVPYIYNGSTWQTLVGQSLEDRVAALETGLAAVDGKIATAIAGANHLTYSVVDGSLPTITEENVGSLTNTVFLVPNGDEEGEDQYVEYMVINNQYEKLGTWGADLSNYATITQLNTAVGNLEDAINDAIDGLQATLGDTYVTLNKYNTEVGDLSQLLTATGKESTTIVGEILDIYDKLTWHDLSAEENNE